MKAVSTELKVGIFALLVIAVLSYMTFRVGDLEWFRKEGYTVYVEFRNIAGLDVKTKVKIAGVDAGDVSIGVACIDDHFEDLVERHAPEVEARRAAEARLRRLRRGRGRGCQDRATDHRGHR